MLRRFSFRQWFIAFCTRLLTKPLRTYELRVPNNLPELKKALKKGDILLVEGDQRVSQVIRYLTQSSWSHSAVYIGDELLREKHGRAAEARSFGEESQHLLIEALVGEGVVLSPLSKYAGYNIRLCRPRLRKEDVEVVINHLIQRLGHRYDVKHIWDLARYFFPVSLVPRRWRRAALHLGSGSEREVICSSMIAKALATVGYPILPRVTIDEAAPPSRWWRRLLSRNGGRPLARFRARDPALITPRDFDLSPYFEIIKFNHLADQRFDYRSIVWERDEAKQPEEPNGPKELPGPTGAASGGDEK
jgi:hypothetical protein